MIARYLLLIVLGLVIAAIPVLASPALASSPARSEPTPAPLSYRAESRSYVRTVSRNGESGPPAGEIRTTRWYRAPDLYRWESVQWAVAKNLAGAPLLESTVVWGPDQQWVASSGANRPDADRLGYPLEPQRVTIIPRSVLPSSIGASPGRVPISDPRKAADAPLGALGQCYEPPWLAEHGTVAGQPVNVFEFRRRPDCASTPGADVAGSAARLLSIDANTGVILKDEALDAAGVPIAAATTEITEIHYGVHLPDSLFEFEPAHGAIVRRCPDLQCVSMSFPQDQPIEAVPDYTVVTLHQSLANNRTSYFAQVALGGSKRDVPVSKDCYERIRRARLDALPDTLSTMVPADCRK